MAKKFRVLVGGAVTRFPAGKDLDRYESTTDRHFDTYEEALEYAKAERLHVAEKYDVDGLAHMEVVEVRATVRVVPAKRYVAEVEEP